jgi:hypothetical protein
MRPMPMARMFTISISASKRWPYSASWARWKASATAAVHASSMAPAGRSKRTS